MEPLQFAYWLQGFAEINGTHPTAEQWQVIKDHLATVFKKVTPPVKAPEVDKDGKWPFVKDSRNPPFEPLFPHVPSIIKADPLVPTCTVGSTI